MPKVTSNSDMTFGRIYNSALRFFIAAGWNPRSAILTAAAYAAHKTR